MGHSRGESVGTLQGSLWRVSRAEPHGMPSRLAGFDRVAKAVFYRAIFGAGSHGEGFCEKPPAMGRWGQRPNRLGTWDHGETQPGFYFRCDHQILRPHQSFLFSLKDELDCAIAWKYGKQ